MLLVLLAAVPGIAAQLWFFGWGTLVQILLASVSALLAEALVLKLRKQSVAATLKDNSALLTGLLLAVSIPPLAPWWMVVLGTVFAVIIAKQLYGGLGQNPFNPAMIGYVVLLISFPVQMTSWLPPHEIAVNIPGFIDAIQVIFSGHTASGGDMNTLRLGIDGISQATPLDTFKTSVRAGHSVEQIMQYPIYSGILAGAGWQWVNLAWLAGGVWLLWQKAIRWHIPLSFLVTLALCAMLGWLFSPETLAAPQIHLLSGATMLGAFFILTDPVTASTTNRGRLIFGALAGLLVWLIRSFGGYPDGVAFAVLLANITVPLIDYYTRPRVYGHRKGETMLKTIRKHGITLALFAAGSTGLTAAINQMTKTTIAEQASLQQKALFDQVLPAERYNNALAQSCYLVTAPELGKGEHRVYIAKQDDKPVAAVLEATAPDGYSGAIQLLVGADFNGTVLGTRVTEHHETPGLGDKIELRLSDWITHFAGKKISGADDAHWAVKKDGGDFDQFTGATITPRAVVNAVKRAGLYAQTLPAQLSQLPACGE
ncbi:electron transport complex, RnfABCDGE type, G subunit [Escherichia coli P0305260.11]|nr:electron transport complex, RnfABCDGE type, G subunit [Escherichia coli P0305260.11]